MLSKVMDSINITTNFYNSAVRAMLESTRNNVQVFVTISGAHLYGFASPDSDFDLRGVFVLPARETLGILPTKQTIDKMEVIDGIEEDYVAHDKSKYALLMLKKNGYVLEQNFRRWSW
jgi:predicted nucleotidyltransferase